MNNKRHTDHLNNPMVLGVVCHKVDKPNLYFLLYHSSGNILANPRVVVLLISVHIGRTFHGLPDFTSKSLFFRGMGCALPTPVYYCQRTF